MHAQLVRGYELPSIDHDMQLQVSASFNDIKSKSKTHAADSIDKTTGNLDLQNQQLAITFEHCPGAGVPSVTLSISLRRKVLCVNLGRAYIPIDGIPSTQCIHAVYN